MTTASGASIIRIMAQSNPKPDPSRETPVVLARDGRTVSSLLALSILHPKWMGTAIVSIGLVVQMIKHL